MLYEYTPYALFAVVLVDGNLASVSLWVNPRRGVCIALILRLDCATALPMLGDCISSRVSTRTQTSVQERCLA